MAPSFRRLSSLSTQNVILVKIDSTSIKYDSSTWTRDDGGYLRVEESW